ncbi:MAG: wfgD [Actinomycetia bacterium]|jgi:hypothetical protein|nr:wfgD [Actinomycetes bacterium]
MSAPTVTVAVPVRNGERYLAEALASVLAQEGVELHVAVYDNLSTDGSYAVAERFLGDSRVTLSCNERDIHYYGSLNRALSESTAEYFVAFACDDLMLPGNLAAKIEALESTGAALAHGRAVLIDDDGRAHAMSRSLDALPRFLPAPEFFLHNTPANSMYCQSVVTRREALLEVGGFDSRVKYCADWLAWMRVALRHGVATLPEPLIAYRTHGESLTAGDNRLGLHAQDMPAALCAMLDDDAFPVDWEGLREPLIGQGLLDRAEQLEADGLLRAAGGWAAYALAGAALVPLAGDDEPLARFNRLVLGAGLTPPAAPFDLVAAPDCDAASVEAFVVALAGFARAGLVGGAAAVCPPDDVAAMAALLEPRLDGVAPELELDLVPAASIEPLLIRGCALLAPFGSPQAAVAEARGVPVLQYGFPDPFARPLDLELWQAPRLEASVR